MMVAVVGRPNEEFEISMPPPKPKPPSAWTSRLMTPGPPCPAMARLLATMHRVIFRVALGLLEMPPPTPSPPGPVAVAPPWATLFAMYESEMLSTANTLFTMPPPKPAPAYGLASLRTKLLPARARLFVIVQPRMFRVAATLQMP